MADNSTDRTAVVLVSGGMDSATVLAMAQRQGYNCHGLIFDYGQRHRVELAMAVGVCEALGAVSHRLFRLGLETFGGSALTDPAIGVPTEPGRDIPATYVPARNTVFLSIALAWAEALHCSDLFIGANAVDYSGYPDCRAEFFAAFERTANLGTRAGVQGQPFRIHVPLLRMSKSAIILQGLQLGVDYSATLSCYQPDQAGRACGVCDSCRLRRRGFCEAGVADPTRYVAEPSP